MPAYRCDQAATIKPDVLRVPPEAEEMEANGAGVGEDKHDLPSGIERLHDPFDELNDPVKGEMLQEVGTKDTIEAFLCSFEIVENIGLDDLQTFLGLFHSPRPRSTPVASDASFS
jgi:hypothetical protein